MFRRGGKDSFCPDVMGRDRERLGRDLLVEADAAERRAFRGNVLQIPVIIAAAVTDAGAVQVVEKPRYEDQSTLFFVGGTFRARLRDPVGPGRPEL